MKYYKVKYVSYLYGWGGLAKFFNIKILDKYKDDEGLLEHEKVHVKAWYVGLAVCLLAAALAYLQGYLVPTVALIAIGIFNQTIMYRWKWYRGWIEALAYRVQIKHGYSKGKPYSSIEFAIQALRYKYGLGLSRAEALDALIK